MVAIWTALFRPSFRGSFQTSFGGRPLWSPSRAIHRTLRADALPFKRQPVAITTTGRRPAKFWVNLPERR